MPGSTSMLKGSRICTPGASATGCPSIEPLVGLATINSPFFVSSGRMRGIPATGTGELGPGALAISCSAVPMTELTIADVMGSSGM